MRKESPQKRKIHAHARTSQEFEKISKNLTGATRLAIGITEIDRVLGGGIVPGSLLLLTGEPGIGKSTLTLQIANQISEAGKHVLYVSGEESEEQISLRGRRLGLPLKNLNLLSENNMETLLATASQEKTDFLIVDSIQVMSSQNIPGGAGSVSQVRLCTEAILEFAKPKKISVLLIGHVTKDGTLAGPRVLEHLVDTVLYLEGSRLHDFRLLRGVKNRFGASSEVGIFEMTECGLSEVKNPASYFVNEHEKKTPGRALTVTVEGSRPLIIEVQALTNTTSFGYPRRTTSGFDSNRLELLLAVIQKYLHINLGNQDVYVNVVGGYRLNDPGCDLGVALAILSSYSKKALPDGLVAIGELGLSGEVRLPKDAAKRTKEAEKLGLKVPSFTQVEKLKKIFE